MKKILQLLIVLIALVSCQKNDVNLPEKDVLPEGIVRVPITLSFPQPSEMITRTTVGLLPDLEKHIERICVLVFKSNGGAPDAGDLLLQVVDGDKTIIAGENGYALLEEYADNCRLQAIVNYSDNFDANLTILKDDIIGGTATYGQFTALTEDLTALYVGGSSGAGQIKIGTVENVTGPLPMYSDLVTETNIHPGTNLSFPLKNIYARITVDASAVATSNYNILEATLLKGATNGSYNKLATTPISTINSGAIKYDKTNAQDKIPTTLVNHVSPIYLFPNNGDGGNNPTDIIIKGNYADSKGNTYTGFHKIRIKHNNSGSGETYDILNNTLYRVVITKVNSAGYDTFSDAESAKPNFDGSYDIIVDDQNSSEIVSNGSYYIGFSNSDFVVYDDDALNNLVSTIFNYDISPGAVAAGIALPTPKVIVEGTGLSLTNPTAIYTSGASNDIEINLATGFTVGKIIFRVGNIAHTVNVEQKAALNSSSSVLNDFATNEYVYGLFDEATMSDWLSFTNAPASSTISSDTGGIPLSLTANSSGLKRTSTPFYLVRKGSKGRTRVVISQKQ